MFIVIGLVIVFLLVLSIFPGLRRFLGLIIGYVVCCVAYQSYVPNGPEWPMTVLAALVLFSMIAPTLTRFVNGLTAVVQRFTPAKPITIEAPLPEPLPEVAPAPHNGQTPGRYTWNPLKQ